MKPRAPAPALMTTALTQAALAVPMLHRVADGAHVNCASALLPIAVADETDGNGQPNYVISHSKFELRVQRSNLEFEAQTLKFKL